MYSWFPSSCHWTQPGMCTCACAWLCVCVPSLYRSGSDITKCWIVPNTCECLSKHIQTLTLMPGNPFINTSPYPAWALILYSGSYPCLHNLLVPLSLKQIWPTSMHGYPSLLAWPLTSDFLHKSASSLWMSSSPISHFYSACLTSFLFNILWTKLTLVAGYSALWMTFSLTLALSALGTS